jgi:hypothetical protein
MGTTLYGLLYKTDSKLNLLQPGSIKFYRSAELEAGHLLLHGNASEQAQAAPETLCVPV